MESLCRCGHPRGLHWGNSGQCVDDRRCVAFEAVESTAREEESASRTPDATFTSVTKKTLSPDAENLKPWAKDRRQPPMAS